MASAVLAMSQSNFFGCVASAVLVMGYSDLLDCMASALLVMGQSNMLDLAPEERQARALYCDVVCGVWMLASWFAVDWSSCCGWRLMVQWPTYNASWLCST
jgi:hypothetical protein